MNTQSIEFAESSLRPRMGDLKVTRFDYLNAALVAGILIAGAVFLILATMLLRQPLPSNGQGHTDGKNAGLIPIETEKTDLVDPLADAPDLADQVINVSLFDQVTDSISAVQSGNLAASDASIKATGTDGGLGTDPRDPMPVIDHDDPSSRWQIRYEFGNLDEYASQLRHFQIELGVVSQHQDDIWRIKDPGKTNLVVHSNRIAESKATYFVPLDNAAKRFDRRLAQSVQANHSSALMVHFYPAQTIELLKAAELKSLPASKSLEHIERTMFRLDRNGDEFEVHVESFEFK